jgi:putative membrane protein
MSGKPTPNKPAPRAFAIGEPQPDESIDIVETADPFAATDQRPAIEPRTTRGFGLMSLFVSAAIGFVALVIGASALSFVENALATSPVLGWAAALLAGLALLALVGLLVREWLGLRRLAKVEAIRADAVAASAADDRDGARRVVARLEAHFAADPSSAAGRQAMAAHRTEIIDGRDLLAIAERELLAGKDALAADLVGKAARRVSVVTAISPRAWVDVLFVLAQSVRLIRQIAAVYGGRPSGLGGARLFRRVLGHLALTGGVAMTDSVLSQLVGAGLAARISAKLGEGVLNGVLTARVGIAAIEMCRPLPYLKAEPLKLGDIAATLLKGGER